MEQPNLPFWEDLARIHGVTPGPGYYDIDALAEGRSSLRDLELTGLAAAVGGDLAGVRVAHVQSHIGIDSIHLARLGAEVTAFDFSTTALGRLHGIAQRCGVRVRTVLADSRELDRPEFAEEHGRYDLVYATIGVLSWIDDLEAWMRGVAALLHPGGRLLLIEIHPLLSMIDTVDPLVIDFPYRHDGARFFTGTGSYADPQAGVSWMVEEHAWSIGEVVTAAIRAGLRVEMLEEHVEAPSDPRGGVLTCEADGRFRLRLAGASSEPLPLVYTLIAAH